MSNIVEASGRNRTRKQVARFLMIGSLSAATDLGGYYFLTSLGVFTGAAKGLSFVAGMVLGWLGNKFWTFESRQRSLAEPVGYLFLYAATLCTNILGNSFLLWGLRDQLPASWTKGLAAFLATALSAALNFLGLRFVVFATAARTQEHPGGSSPDLNREVPA